MNINKPCSGVSFWGKDLATTPRRPPGRGDVRRERMKCSILIHRSDGCTRAFVFYTKDEDELENESPTPPLPGLK